MHLKPFRVVAVFALGALAVGEIAPAPVAEADVPAIYPLSKVRRGQTGYGMTTMQGTKPERFEFEVVGINKNFLPKQDIILVKSEDPKLAISGFWQGMSGSPLYIDDKLVCAFSYGFRFNKIALGGCTPIEYMKREGLDVPRRMSSGFIEESSMGAGAAGAAGKKSPGKAGGTGAGAIKPRASLGASADAEPLATMDEWLRVAPGGDAGAAMTSLAPTRAPWILAAPMPARPTVPTNASVAAARDGSEVGMIASAVPLAMSGFSAPAFAEAQALFADYPIEPMRAGGTGGGGASADSEIPEAFVMGGAISVQMVRGDMSMAGTGTVSYIDGERVLAFGHPMFQTGEFYAPVSTAEINTVIPSAQSAFIVASPLREIGALVQDRQSTIMADTSLRSPMVPLDVYIEAGSEKSTERGEFHVEILNNKFFTGPLAGIAAGNAVQYYLPDRDDATAYVESSVWMHGRKDPLSFVDYLSSNEGAGGIIGGVRGLRVIVPLMLNPYQPLEIDRVEVRVKLTWNTNYGDINELRLDDPQLTPGVRNYVDVVMTTYDGKDLVERVPFDVPKSLAGAIVQLDVSAGDAARLDAAPPADLDSLIAAFRKLLPGNVFAVTLSTADEGVAVDGIAVADLPPSAIDKLHPSTSTQRADLYRPLARSLVPSKRVINGSASVLVRVGDVDH